jgi:membrane protease YdiL (CAAX protease family)
VWRTTVPALAALGVAALVVGPAWSPEVEPAVSLVVGAVSGSALYAATRVFVRLVRRWETFHRHSLATYLRQGDRPLVWALALSVGLAVPGEELFWRGLFQPELGAGLDGRAGLAAIVGWAAYVAANLPSANLAIVAGAVVGGAVWSGLGWWTGGALAPLASHGVWTTLMLWLPVIGSGGDG